MTTTRDRPKIRVLLVDDHHVVRAGVRALLAETGTIEVVGEAGTAAEAVEQSTRLQPDVVLMDLRLGDGSGLEASREIKPLAPASRVLFLTSFADDDAVLATLLAGAAGYVLKDIGQQALVRAIEAVAGGQSILDPRVARMARETTSRAGGGPEDTRLDGLSVQETRVLRLVMDGKTNKEIAQALDLSDKTVKNYLSNVFQKLGVTRRSHAAVLFAQRRALRAPDTTPPRA
jgi:two-component system, NarL family, response regulator DevR